MKSAFYPMLAAMTVALAANSRSLAATVTNYDFGTVSSTYASSDTDPNSTAGNITLGAGFTSAGISVTAGNPADSLFIRPADNSTEANAFSGNRYFTFTLTPVSGTLSFSSLSFDYRRDASGSAQHYALYASTTGSFTSGGHIDTNATAFAVSSSAFSNYSVSLTAITALQNVSAPVQFRLYVWGAATQTDVFRFDNIVLSTAAASIPEPSAYALTASGFLGALVLLRRRRQASGVRPLVRS